MLKKILLLLAAAGTCISFYLVMSEIMLPGFCARIFFLVPACYSGLASYIAILASCFILNKKWETISFYYGFISGIGLSLWLSYNHFEGVKRCIAIRDIPLCYVSLATLVLIIILKVLGEIKIRVRYR